MKTVKYTQEKIEREIKFHTSEIQKLLLNIRTLRKLTRQKIPALDNMINLYLDHKKKIKELTNEYMKLMKFQDPVQFNRPLNIASLKRSNPPVTKVASLTKSNLDANAVSFPPLDRIINSTTDEPELTIDELSALFEEIEEEIGKEYIEAFKDIPVNPNQKATAMPSDVGRLDCNAQNRHPSHVGIVSSNNPNNCYINVLFQMLFQMCEFKNRIISHETPFENPAMNEVKQILLRYQALYDQNPMYLPLTLPNKDLKSIKNDIYRVNENNTQANDPLALFTTPLIFNTGRTKQIAEEYIFNNPFVDEHDPNRFIFSLDYSSDRLTSIQELINAQENIGKFNPQHIMSNYPIFSQKYLLLNIQNIQGKSKPPVVPDPLIRINQLTFNLKGIIVFLASGKDGHYVYVTYDPAGNLSFIYNNQIVIEHILHDVENEVHVSGIDNDEINASNIQLFTKLLQNKNNAQNNFLEQGYEETIQNGGYIFLYEESHLEPRFDPSAATLDAESLDTESLIPGSNSSETASASAPVGPRSVSSASVSTLSTETASGSNLSVGPRSVSSVSTGTAVAAAVAAGPGPEITKPEFEFAIRIIRKLFDIKQNEEIKEKTVKTNLEELKKKIKKYTTNDQNRLLKIIGDAYNFYNNTSKTFLGKIKKYEEQSVEKKQVLKIIYDLFADDYKNLSFMNSNIILKPSINGATRKQTAGLLCDQISELINPIRMNKTIPSQTPNLTKRNITRRVVKEEKKQKIADKAKAVTDKAKAVANEAILKQTKEQIEAANKDIKELKSQQLLARIAELSQEITVLKANAAAAAAAAAAPGSAAPVPVPRNAIRDLTQKQEELEKLKKQLEKELDKKGGKTGGKTTRKVNNKLKQQNKDKNKKRTRRSNK